MKIDPDGPRPRKRVHRIAWLRARAAKLKEQAANADRAAAMVEEAAVAEEAAAVEEPAEEPAEGTMFPEPWPEG
jgi:septal ring factor EnvC (AmiA/AmiB activator)